MQQAENIIDATAKVEGLEKFVLSTLSSAKKWSKGKYTLVYHFDSKADAVDYLKEKQAALWKKMNLIMIGIYLSNYLRDSFSEIKKICPAFPLFFAANL